MNAKKVILQLKIALACYADATDVKSFGYEELRDNGELARKALGFGAFHAEDCAWPNGYSKPAEYNYETGEWSETGEYISGERCTCGLQDTIDAAIAKWSDELKAIK